MRIKKALTVTLLSAALLAGGAGVAHAETVYYKGSAISWDHGRSWGGNELLECAVGCLRA